jgi:hypothetical protein
VNEHVEGEHVEGELLALLTGELDRSTTATVAGHLRACEPCRARLVDSAVIHGSLTSASRAEAQLRIPAYDQEQSALPAPDIPEVQPPLGFRPSSSHHRFRTSTLAAVAAAAVVVMVGLVGLGWAVGRQSPAAPGAPVSAVASLRHVDAPASATGMVVVKSVGSTRQMHIRIDGIGEAPAGHYYEVWLFSPASNTMLPVGILPPSGTGSFELSASLMAQFSAIDVSLQVNDGNATHSSQSVLRGPIQSIST